jgi:hypothetical protein
LDAAVEHFKMFSLSYKPTATIDFIVPELIAFSVLPLNPPLNNPLLRKYVLFNRSEGTLSYTGASLHQNMEQPLLSIQAKNS